MTVNTQQNHPLSLQGLRVGISGAIPEPEESNNIPDLARLTLRFVSQLSSLILDYGGEIVHGTHPTFTPVLADQARSRLGRENPPPPLTLVCSKLFGNPPAAAARAHRFAKARLLLTDKIGEGDARDTQTRNDSLTALRLALTQHVDVLIAIGGKLHLQTGFNPGVLEEMTLARWHGVECFVVGSLGGMANKIDAAKIQAFAEPQLASPDLANMAQCTEELDLYAGRLALYLATRRAHLLEQRVRREIFAPIVKLYSLIDSPAAPRADLDIDVSVVQRFAKRFSLVREAFSSGNVNSLNVLLDNPPA
jgi:hypothetical protein